IVDRAGIGGEIGPPEDELAARERGAEADLSDRDRPQIAVDEIGEEILAAKRLDRAAIDIAAGDRIALARAAAVEIFGDRGGQARDRGAAERRRPLHDVPAEIGAAVG